MSSLDSYHTFSTIVIYCFRGRSPIFPSIVSRFPVLVRKVDIPPRYSLFDFLLLDLIEINGNSQKNYANIIKLSVCVGVGGVVGVIMLCW